MNEKPTTVKPLSLDDLLAANKQRFDELFARTAGPVKGVQAQVHPPSQADLASASLEMAGADSNVTNLLNDRFGDTWSSEVWWSTALSGIVCACWAN